MGEAQDRYNQMRESLRQMSERRQNEEQERREDHAKALYDLANDLTYPMDSNGNQMNVHMLIPLLSEHLARCGYRKHEELATIKQIPHPRRGHAQVAEDAVLYVPVDATGTIPQAFVPTPEEQPSDPMNDMWRTKTHITVDGDTIKGGP
ncbi:minor tail protein [Mycobacterium phage JacoRen57]|nr:minor tail protein [Mycobacterium phage JacoRen57]